MNRSFWLRLLGGMSVERFFTQFWQRRPLFVKSAIAPEHVDLPPERLWSLAADPDVESRLVTRSQGRWRLRHGPFDSKAVARRPWSLLVQGVDLHDAQALAMFDRFRCLPHVRLDDVMISLSGRDGGVGPHYDAYDVFLIQGRRLAT